MSKISDTTNKIAELKKDIAELELSLNDELKQSFQNFDVTTDGASGNAGDWAEIYVFYRVMEQGKIKTAKTVSIKREYGKVGFMKVKDCPHIEVSIKCPHMITNSGTIRKGGEE